MVSSAPNLFLGIAKALFQAHFLTKFGSRTPGHFADVAPVAPHISEHHLNWLHGTPQLADFFRGVPRLVRLKYQYIGKIDDFPTISRDSVLRENSQILVHFRLWRGNR
jgi:hypothetical protein